MFRKDRHGVNGLEYRCAHEKEREPPEDMFFIREGQLQSHASVQKHFEETNSKLSFTFYVFR